jgi:5-methylcytosine-specific restriction endonuclease McrA
VPRALLLNADWTPMHFVSDWRAVRLLMPDIHGKIRAEVVHDFTTGEAAFWEEAFTSPGATPDAPLKSLQIPATLRLRKYVHKRWKAPRFRKKVLFNRDGWKCQYCATKLGWHNIEIEHVMPSSRGGATSWLNCVSACKSCNKRKANKTPEEAGMLLLKKPSVPTPLHFWDALKSDSWHSSWNTFIPRNGE